MRVVPIAVAAALAWPMAALAQPPAEDVVSGFRILDRLDPCRGPTMPEEIVVCGRRAEQNRYRLPLPSDRGAARAGDNIRGEVPRGTIELNAASPCGIFEGQRRCNRAEMAEFGYGQGRDPITVVGDIIEALADPD